MKLQASFNLETRTIERFKTTPGTEHECRHLEGHLPRRDQMLGGRCRKNCRLIAEKEGTSYIKSKKNSLEKAKGCCHGSAW